MTGIEQKRRVNTILVYCNRIRPFPVNVIGINIEIFIGRIIVGNHVKTTFMVTNGGGKYTTGGADFIQHDLRVSCKDMSDLLPIYKVVAFKKGYSRKELKRTADHVKVSVSITYTWIRIEAAKDRILIDHS